MSPASITVPETTNLAPLRVLPVTRADYGELALLHDEVFGPGALTRTAYRVREGCAFHSPFCRLTRDGETLIAAIRFTPIRIGGVGGGVMIGPLMVATAQANRGHARRLIRDGLMAAQAAGCEIGILVGDAAYYGRLGFVQVAAGQIAMPGPVDPARLLAFELAPGAIARYRGVISGDV